MSSCDEAFPSPLTPYPSPPLLPEMTELWQETLGWNPSTEQQTKFQQLYEHILEGNRQLNLTRITEPQEFWEKHLWDSLRGIRSLIRESLTSIRAIDIGTGAGFPGIPVAIAQPQWRLTLLDSTRKKIQFLDQLLRGLRTLNATTLIERVENIGQSSNYRETYDVALIRAVSGASVCAEYALPLLKVGGLAVLYRGQWTEKETLALRPAVEKLGGQIELVEAFKTPLTESDRHCLYLRKVTSTPKEFPRGVGLAVQKPLEETL